MCQSPSVSKIHNCRQARTVRKKCRLKYKQTNVFCDTKIELICLPSKKIVKNFDVDNLMITKEWQFTLVHGKCPSANIIKRSFFGIQNSRTNTYKPIQYKITNTFFFPSESVVSPFSQSNHTEIIGLSSLRNVSRSFPERSPNAHKRPRNVPEASPHAQRAITTPF